MLLVILAPGRPQLRIRQMLFHLVVAEPGDGHDFRVRVRQIKLLRHAGMALEQIEQERGVGVSQADARLAGIQDVLHPLLKILFCFERLAVNGDWLPACHTPVLPG